MSDPTPAVENVKTESKDILAVISLLCGVTSLFCFCCVCQFPIPAVGIVTGSFALNSRRRRLAQIGIGLSILGLIMTALWYLLVLLGQVDNPGFMKWEHPYSYGPATTMPAD